MVGPVMKKMKPHFNFFLVVEVKSLYFDLRVCHGTVDYYYLVSVN
jgi:hypothetical protein